jgi:hypothetical protein
VAGGMSGGSPQERFAAVVDDQRGDAAVSEGRMFGSPGLKLGGKVFALLVKERLAVKLPAERVAALVAAGDGVPFDPGHGRVMREWVAVPAGSDADWLALALEAKAFIAVRA